MTFSTRKILAAASTLLGLGLALPAAAHDQAGSLTSTAGTKATDYYVATCYSDPALGGGANADRFYFQMKDNSAGANQVGMTVVNNNAPTNDKARTTIDANGGDGTYSDAQTISGGNGDYLITVFHTGVPSLESYTFIYHCETTAGVHTGTSIVRLSNQ